MLATSHMFVIRFLSPNNHLKSYSVAKIQRAFPKVSSISMKIMQVTSLVALEKGSRTLLLTFVVVKRVKHSSLFIEKGDPHKTTLESPLLTNSFFDKKFKSIGTSSGYSIVSLFLPGHFIPAPLFNEFSSRPGT